MKQAPRAHPIIIAPPSARKAKAGASPGEEFRKACAIAESLNKKLKAEYKRGKRSEKNMSQKTIKAGDFHELLPKAGAPKKPGAGKPGEFLNSHKPNLFILIGNSKPFKRFKQALKMRDSQMKKQRIGQALKAVQERVWFSKRLREAGSAGQVMLYSALLQQGADVNATDAQGVTALMEAAFQLKPVVARFLLSKNASAFRKDSTGNTALDWARMGRNSLRACAEKQAEEGKLAPEMAIKALQAIEAAFEKTCMLLRKVDEHELYAGFVKDERRSAI